MQQEGKEGGKVGRRKGGREGVIVPKLPFQFSAMLLSSQVIRRHGMERLQIC